MKKNLIIALMGAVLVISGCEPKGEKSESTAQSQASAQRKANVLSMRAEIEAQRKDALYKLSASSPTYKSMSGGVVYYKAEVDPSYIGGVAALDSFLKENLKFPEVAEMEGQEGTVFVDFVVAENGAVTEATATTHTYGNGQNLFSAEALRVVNLMPNWTPGSQNGKAVNVKFSVPITFLIN